MRLGKACPHHRVLAELRANARQRAISRRRIAGRPLDEQSLLRAGGPDGTSGDAQLGDSGLQRQRLQPKPYQAQQLGGVQRRGGGTDRLALRTGPVQPQVQRQRPQRLVARGDHGQQPVQQPLDREEQARDVGLGVVEVVPRDERIPDP